MRSGTVNALLEKHRRHLGRTATVGPASRAPRGILATGAPALKTSRGAGGVTFKCVEDVFVGKVRNEF